LKNRLRQAPTLRGKDAIKNARRIRELKKIIYP
jgi:hypothetical protein